MNDITVKIDKVAVNHTLKEAQRALGLTGYLLQKEIRQEQVIPRDTGYLEDVSFQVVDQSEKNLVQLKFTARYARRLYYHPEYNFSKKENPNAQGYWMRPWLKGGKYENQATEMFANILKKGI